MAVLSDADILKLHKSGTLDISPFHEDALEPASYDMRLYWKVLLSPTRYEIGREIDLREQPDQEFAIEPGRFVAILTAETLAIPLNLSGRFGLRSEFTRQGLVAFPGIQVDPGFRGRLAISLFNAGPESVKLKHDAKMFTVEFHTLETPTRRGYSGTYQDQLDFPDDQKEFILHAQTVSLSEIRSLPSELATLALRVARHEATHQKGQPPLTVAEIAKIQGVQPLANWEDLANGWPEDEDVDSFIAAVRRWRQR